MPLPGTSPHAGYTFDKWDKSNKGPFTEDTTITAIYKPTTDPGHPDSGSTTSPSPAPDASIEASAAGILPNTGEADDPSIWAAASLSILAGLGLLGSQKRKKEEKSED
ncbi:LPXTG cell wall anchor domain-containing protein [Dolosicoccus paucivorans]